MTVDIHQLLRSAKPVLLPQGSAKAMSQPELSQAKNMSMSPKLMRASVCHCGEVLGEENRVRKLNITEIIA
jgi:hypothetical protein